ncbi:D-alanyl-D-alanine carboxypeptidase family protein [Lentzea flava]|uniref:D-alanyl-D-alanine carboxypeptidase n=1 Tax=Lentzea flava TaxID=103732 RepID=A0ABQ2V518_9PSEU|nr:D-alanyl-D-alanine carboxypeptidase family protein [Lentzea flava]MCP2203157.1 D-alanyl-D-alanine carboxypeptidase (penicillin-binding protein 5/6) [Lentzea flava]GGU65774.1 D-alanyl-D-alanine carboxypeptidase [Lentzea flava]
MPFTKRLIVALVLATATAAFAAPTGTAQQAASAQCANRETPPPPVDTSEQPAPGQKAPPPLEVPEKPIGGDRLGECGLILPPNSAQPPSGITAASWLLADIDSGAVLAAYDPHGRQRPASVIKVLLAMVVAKELRGDLVVTASAEDTQQECTCVGLKDGGQYTVRQLLQGLLLTSGNDVAHTLARQLGGVPNALRKMNAMAKELGALDTRAVTPSGLDAPGTSTSAYDVGLIFRGAMKYDEFAQAIKLQQAQFPGRNGGTIMLNNDNRLLTSYQGAIGGKTGYTDDSQHTYVGAAERNGRRLVVVLLRGQQQPTHITNQAAKLLDYGFAMGPGGVGKLVDGAPQPKPKVTSTQENTETSNDSAAADSNSGRPTPTAFGTVGLPITAAAGIGLLAAVFLYIRNKRAKAARARRQAAQAAQGV